MTALSGILFERRMSGMSSQTVKWAGAMPLRILAKMGEFGQSTDSRCVWAIEAVIYNDMMIRDDGTLAQHRSDTHSMISSLMGWSGGDQNLPERVTILTAILDDR